MNAPANLSKVGQLRLRDGEVCWLCGGKLDFAAPPGSRKAPTLEHLVAKANGGGNGLDNLVLTHPGCNKHLADKPRQEKLRIRAKWQANQAGIAAARQVRADTPVEDGGNKGRQRAQVHTAQLRGKLRRWQLATVIASGAALLATGLAAGLAIAR
uniref:HNH endonuclease n=1 Tax=uncultured Sphingomonas sp. TaxID=158754 RepID=UPI0025E1F1B5|nr:HNH endonuclease [uncultured Sphingomonas sp.]